MTTEEQPAWLSLIRRNGWVQAFLLTAGWLMVWMSGTLAEYSDHASFWFPPSGLTFAALLIVGNRAIPILFFGAVISTFLSAQLHGIAMTPVATLQAGMAFGLAHVLPYYLGAILLRLIADSTGHRLPNSTIGFLVVAALSSLLAMACVLLSLVATDLMVVSEIAGSWLPFWIGDMVSVMVLAPLFASVLLKLYPNPVFWLEDIEIVTKNTFPTRFAYKLLVSSVFLTLAMLVASRFRVPESAFILFFLIIPQMWITYSESAFRTAISLAVFSFLIVLWVHLFDLQEFLMVYQFAICVVSASAYFGLAVPVLTADNRQLREKVVKDSLTQAASRDFLMGQVELELGHCTRSGQPLSLIIIDIDHFKGINDDFGHAVGDKALVCLSEAAREVLRAFDTLGRIGGDEFVVLLPNTDIEAASVIAERIRARIREIKLANDCQISVSIGVAAYRPEDSSRALIERADVALYRSKSQGRDRVSVES